jgi:Holin of 3TMs, for gene-transfer release
MAKKINEEEVDHSKLSPEQLTEHIKTYHLKRESGFRRYWRPAMAWQYFTVCIFDFLVGPMIHAWTQLGAAGPLTQWVPLTLQAGGLYHIAMGAMIGIYAWTRSLEKINLMNKGIIPAGEEETIVSTEAEIEKTAKE